MFSSTKIKKNKKKKKQKNNKKKKKTKKKKQTTTTKQLNLSNLTPDALIWLTICRIIKQV